MLRQKTNNLASKYNGKIIGGMSFTGNVTATSVGAGNTWVALGNGTLFTSTISPNLYFDIRGAATGSQRLHYTKGKNTTTVGINWGLVLITTVSAVSVDVRLAKLDVEGNTTILQTLNGSASLLGNQISGNLTKKINIGDFFYVEINNVDAENPTRNVTVNQAFLRISE